MTGECECEYGFEYESGYEYECGCGCRVEAIPAAKGRVEVVLLSWWILRLRARDGERYRGDLDG